MVLYVSVIHFFLSLSNHFVTSRWCIICIQLLGVMTNADMSTYIHIFDGVVFLFLLDKYIGVQLLGIMIIAYLTL